MQALRNIAIIAHVDHGKTTLVDKLLKQSGALRYNQAMPERVMDSNELERERGITILSKNTSVFYNHTKINIVDTPGHADFGGEVERIMRMVDGVLLLVDAFEGPMPQTRFVLAKALHGGLKPIVMINKIDRPGADPDAVVDRVLDLFIDLEASEELLDFPVVYGSAREGYAVRQLGDQPQDMGPLLDMILEELPPPDGDPTEPLQMMISALDHDNYVGRIGIGRIQAGLLHKNQEVILCNPEGKELRVKVNTLYTFEGLQRVEVQEAKAGEIVALSGIAELNIGDTLCHPDVIRPLPFVPIDEPTISMNFLVNDSPMSGQEGTLITSRHLRERLQRELLSNVSLRVQELSPDCFKVSGRGELHLSILIETMRREGYEFAVSRPEVILKEINGKIYEPLERLFIDVPEEYMGVVIEGVGQRRGELINISNPSGGSMKLEFSIPARGLIGYRSELLTVTRGTGVINHCFDQYAPRKGEINRRSRGALIASEAGDSVTYGLYNAQERGFLFIGPGVVVYEGMIVGENARMEDIVVNVCKRKQLTNTRASGADEALRVTPPVIMSLEKCMEFINDDELLEITPASLRLRKQILRKEERQRSQKSKTRTD